ncbi:hypothetical protein KR026_011330 [Drosophila bipectinata]|nr:hypothetical protein KR026_011330 [Drosophila bipectinata]
MASQGLIIIIICCCLVQLEATLFNMTNSRELERKERLIRLLHRLRLEEDFNTLLVYGKDCLFHSLLEPLRIPSVIVASSGSNFDWNFSSSTLILTCEAAGEVEESQQTLQKLQRSRHLVLIAQETHPELVCKDYNLKELFNVAMVKPNFDQTDVIYSCRYFETPNYEKVNFFENKPIYIENFRNMKGFGIRTVADSMPPRTIRYVDPNTNQLKMKGYLSHLLNTYSEKVNAKLEFLHLSKKATIQDISRMAGEGVLDIATGVGSSLQHSTMDTISYPYLLTSYCLMVPKPANVPFNLVYSMIVDPVVLSIILALFWIFSILLIFTQNLSWRGLSISNLVFNDKSLRGLLGQSFPLRNNPNKHLKLVIFLLCFVSVMITTMYEAYLQSFFARPPSEPFIRDFPDIANFSHIMSISRVEANVLTGANNVHFREINKDQLLIYDNWTEYLSLRDSLKTNFIFPVTLDRWECFEEQQKLFAKPTYYMAHNLCFTQFMFFSVPLRKYLPHRHLFEDHILRAHEFGLVKFWKARSYFEMVEVGLASLKDLSQKQKPQSLLLEDISRILKVYACAILLSICFFILKVFEYGRVFKRFCKFGRR